MIFLILVSERLCFLLKYVFETLFKKNKPQINHFSRNKSNMQKALCCSLTLFQNVMFHYSNSYLKEKEVTET